MKTAIAASKVAPTEKVVNKDIIKLHTFTLQNGEKKRNFAKSTYIIDRALFAKLLLT